MRPNLRPALAVTVLTSLLLVLCPGHRGSGDGRVDDADAELRAR